jgi:hypothetical protein
LQLVASARTLLLRLTRHCVRHLALRALADHLASYTETLATGQPVHKCQEMRLRTLDGRWIWFKNSFCHSGTRWHAMLRDLSEAKRVEVRAAPRCALGTNADAR